MPDKFLTGHSELAGALCKALRIPVDEGFVEGFELRVFGGEIVSLKVTHYVRESDVGNLVKTLSEFNFELKSKEG